LLLPAAGYAVDINVIGLFPGKAVIVIDAGPIRTLSVGQKTAEGVTLLSSDRESATFDIDGQKKKLKTDRSDVDLPLHDEVAARIGGQRGALGRLCRSRACTVLPDIQFLLLSADVEGR